MELDAFRARARATSERLSSQPGEGLDTFQRDALAFFSRVPEPPLYRRRDDPVRALAATLLEEAVTLTARAWRLGPQVGRFPPAFEAHGLMLALLVDGRVEAAEPMWHAALAAEREATGPLRLWSRTDSKRPVVFDETTRRSRFDPQPEAQVEARLVCPSCRKASGFSLSPRTSTHALACRGCQAPFTAYVAELRTLEVKALARNRRRYHFAVEELAGASARVEFDDANTGELSASRRDLIAFLYDQGSILRGVLNLNTSRVLWVSTPGPCFIATVAFGEGAPELTALRGFRDRVLLRSATGRWATHGYYRFGPALAGVVGRSSRLRDATRAGLRAVIPVLERWP